MKNTNLMMTMIMAFCGWSNPAEGTLIRHTFGGTITHVTGVPQPPWEGAGIGSIWELSYIFDTEMPDLNPGDPERGRYFLDNGSIAVDGVEQFFTFGEVEVLDGFIGFDEYRIGLIDPIFGAGGVSLGAPPGTLASDVMPVEFDLANWDFRQFEFGNFINFGLRGDVLTFTSELVPVPGGLPLILLGSCLFIRNRRRSNSV